MVSAHSSKAGIFDSMGFVSICVTGRLDVWKGADSAERCVQVLEQHMLPKTSLDFHQRKTFFLE